MSKTAANIVSDIRKSRLLSMNTLAALAGVPASTISRIESGKIEPTYSLLSRIVSAAGFAFDPQVQEGGSDQPIATYLEQLKENEIPIETVSSKELMTVASLAPVAKRQGAQRFELDRELEEVISDLKKQGQRPVVSALEAYAGNIDALQSFTPVLYTEAPEEIENMKPATMRSAQVVFVIPTTDNVRENSYEIEGTKMVSREWGVLDALASPGRQPDAALEIFTFSDENAL